MKKRSAIFLFILLITACLLLTGFGGIGNRDRLNGSWVPAEGHGSISFTPDGIVLGYASSGVTMWTLKSFDEKQFVLAQTLDYGSYSESSEITMSYVLSEDGKELTLTMSEMVVYDAEGKEQARQQSSGDSVFRRFDEIFGTWESEDHQAVMELRQDGTASSTVAGEQGPEQLLMVEPDRFNIVTLSEETGLIETVEQFSYTLSEDGSTMTVTYETMCFYDEKGSPYSEEYQPIEMVLIRK